MIRVRAPPRCTLSRNVCVLCAVVVYPTYDHLESRGLLLALGVCWRKEERADFRRSVDGVDNFPHDREHRIIGYTKPRRDVQVGPPREHSQAYRQSNFHLDNPVRRAAQSCVRENAEAAIKGCFRAHKKIPPTVVVSFCCACPMALLLALQELIQVHVNQNKKTPGISPSVSEERAALRVSTSYRHVGRLLPVQFRRVSCTLLPYIWTMIIVIFH